MLPICWAKPCANAPSGSVLVSAGELANSASIALATSAARSGSFTRTTYQPTMPFAARAALVEVVVAEEEAGRVRALLRAVVDADDVELPGAVALARPDRRDQRHAVADLPPEPLGQRRGRRSRRCASCSQACFWSSRQHELRVHRRGTPPARRGICRRSSSARPGRCRRTRSSATAAATPGMRSMRGP